MFTSSRSHYLTSSKLSQRPRTTLCEYPDYYLGATTAAGCKVLLLYLAGVKGGPPLPADRPVAVAAAAGV